MEQIDYITALNRLYDEEQGAKADFQNGISVEICVARFRAALEAFQVAVQKERKP